MRLKYIRIRIGLFLIGLIIIGMFLMILLKTIKIKANSPASPINVTVPASATTYSSIAVIWDKPENYEKITGYDVYINDKCSGSTNANETFYTVENLEAGTDYQITVRARAGKYQSKKSKIVKVKTDIMGSVRDVTMPPYYAKGDGITLDTECIQKAIDDCDSNDIVLLPEGKTFLSGALDLKSDIRIEINGTLLGSNNVKDYEKVANKNGREGIHGGGISEGLVYTEEAPQKLIWSRVEGWEQYTYRSLINIGYLSENTDYSLNNNYVCTNVKIFGTGTIKGDLDDALSYYSPSGGNVTMLAVNEGESADQFYDIVNSQTDENNIRRRIRGRLINISNAQNIYIKGITLENPPFWTMHMIYSDAVTTNGVDFQTSGLSNGDGWDPDSSTNCTIFNSHFNTGDDCIAIKSGKNPEGNKIGRPSKNIKVLGCIMDAGNGIAVGSEMSGGVEGVYVRDCCLSNSYYGIEFKASKARGGYIKNVYVSDSIVDQILIHSVTYNSDGIPADTVPIFSNFYFNNLEVIGYDGHDNTWINTAIQITGFTSENKGNDSIKNITFQKIILGTETNIDQSISLKNCKGICFNDVKQTDGIIPEYVAEESEDILVDGKNIIDSN